MTRINQIEYLILATIAHALIIFLLWPYATSSSFNNQSWIMWATIALMAFHYFKLLTGSIERLTRP